MFKYIFYRYHYPVISSIQIACDVMFVQYAIDLFLNSDSFYNYIPHFPI